MFQFLNRYCKFTIFAYDSCAIILAWLFSYLVRYGLLVSNDPSFSEWKSRLPLLFIPQIISFWYFKTNRGIWRFLSIIDLLTIIFSVFSAYSISLTILFFTGKLNGHGRIIYFIYPITLLLIILAGRVVTRAFADLSISKISKDGQRVLIIGAGKAGVELLRDIRSQTNLNMKVVGFLDDNTTLKNHTIDRLPVFGEIASLESTLMRARPDLLIIAIPSLASQRLKEVTGLCESTGLPTRILPSTAILTSEKLLLSQLKDISLEDLLGREPIILDRNELGIFIKDKIILITGAGGSIGSELCRQIIPFSPQKILITDMNEYNLYKIEREFSSFHPEMNAKFFLLDINDKVAVKSLIEIHKPEIVFHAAAFKQVPLLEHQIRQAVRNNLLGTQNLADICADSGVEKFIMISTDKAVNPTNIMGATKRLAEIYCQNLNTNLSNKNIAKKEAPTKFITVRFGNVLGSTGSVVPLFKDQLSRGGPLTVTHPDVIRYFMTIPEASQLVLQAAQMGKGGEIFVLDMGQPLKIVNLAEQIIRLSGKIPYKDIDIIFTGLRPGEKLFEELFHENENLHKTDKDKILIAQSRIINFDLLVKSLYDMKESVDKMDDCRLLELLQNLVPEASLKTPPNPL